MSSSRTKKLVTTIALLLLSIATLMPSPGSSAVARSDSRGAQLKQAANEWRKGNYEQAEAIYRRLVSDNPADNQARLLLSHSLIKQNRLQEAYDEAWRVASSDHSSARARALMGVALLRTGQFQAASAHLTYAFEKDPRDALALGALAEIEIFENRSKPAYDAFRRAIALDPREPDLYRPFARTCSRLELYSEAADALERFLRVAPQTEIKQRARIEGVIRFFRKLGDRRLNIVGGPEVATIQFDLIGNRPFLNVMVNGRGPFRFVLDTGASFSLISAEAARKLGVERLAQGGDGRAVGGGGTFPLIYGLLDSVAIGNARIERVPVYIRTIHQAADAPSEQYYDGYFGLSLLSNYLMTLDYKHRTLVLDRRPPKPETVPADEPGAIPISLRTTRDGLASAETFLPSSAQPLNFIVDTGASLTVVSRALVKRDKLESLIIPDEKYRVVGAAGIDHGVEALRLGAIRVDSLKKSNTRALILSLDVINEDTGFEQHGILGGDFLRHFRMQLDLRKFELRLTPQNAQIELVKSQSGQ
jgi:tetratricopeptide (TPR) repeat protein